MSGNYLILNNYIAIKNRDNLAEPSGLSDFSVLRCPDGQAQMILKVSERVQTDSCYGLHYMMPETLRNIRQLFFSRKSPSALLYAEDDDYSDLTLYCGGDLGEEAFMELFMAGFYSRMALHQTMLVHASAVEYEGHAVVFTASSGTGKTTQAELWNQYCGAKILNGDKVFLKQEEDAIHAWGSPWKGSSSYGMNASAPLRAIVVLEQDNRNSIRRLDTMEAMELFVPHIFFPRWDERCELAVMEFLDKVMSEIDIYLLKCRPEQSAVELTIRMLREEKRVFLSGE